MIKTITKSNLGKNGLISLSSYREIRGGIQGWHLEVENETEAIQEHCLLPVPHACSACSLMPPRTISPGLVPPTMRLVLLYQLLIKKMLCPPWLISFFFFPLLYTYFSVLFSVCLNSQSSCIRKATMFVQASFLMLCLGLVSCIITSHPVCHF